LSTSIAVAASAAHSQTAATTETPTGWSSADIELAQARCAAVLRGLDIVAQPVAPVRDHTCGAPAPLELISVGRLPQVTFYPTITVTCDMAAALHRWVKGDLQPLARKHLGGQIIRIDTMSSYSCRTAYGRKNAKLSEHGRANAVDIAAFLTDTGATTAVLTHWGMTGAEIASQVASAKRQDALRAAHTPPPAATVATGSVPGSGPGQSLSARPSMALRPSISVAPAANNTAALPSAGTGLGLVGGAGTPPARLGGPKDNEAATDFVATAKTDFLRAAHDSACRVFGTVLGPEANSAHRNHFHVDMAERRSKSICE
jgi:hypothetical protein